MTHAGARLGAAVLTAVLAATTMAGPGAAADSLPGDPALHWLEKQLNKDDLIHNKQYDFDDYGLTADVAIALSHAGQGRDVRRVADALAAHVDSWTTGADFGAPGDIYAGSVAKAAHVALLASRDPRSFGGVDLIERLEGRVSSEGANTGRLEDAGAVDYANVIGQTFAFAALAEANSPRSADVQEFLLQQQCEGGWFRLNFSPKDAADQSCDADEASAADTDATALAVMMLRGTVDARKAGRRAARWLLRTQRDNGSFGGGPTTKKSNTNSTGLAGHALYLELTTCDDAQKAAGWVQDRQVRGKLKGTSLARERGAIAYDRAALRAARTDGITTETRDQWRRATAQAANVLQSLNPGACSR